MKDNVRQISLAPLGALLILNIDISPIILDQYNYQLS